MRGPGSWRAAAARAWLGMVCGAAAALGLPSPAAAHPGSGIVVDRAGQVYFVVFGSSRIMRIDIGGRLTVFIDDVRIRNPHHLSIDADGNLYTVSDDDSRVWRISPDREFTALYAPTAPDAPRVGAWGDPFTIDAAGAIYLVREPLRDRIFRVGPDGIEPFGDSAASFGNLHGATMAWGPDGALYVTDRTRVRRIAPDGTVSLVNDDQWPALDLAMGLTLGPEGTIYVADYGERRVVRLGPGPEWVPLGAGRFFRPSGVALGPAGALYVLDATPRGVRVWHVAPDGALAMASCLGPVSGAVELGTLVVVPLLLAGWMWARRASPLKDRLVRAVICQLAMLPVLYLGWLGCTSRPLHVASIGLVVVVAVVSVARIKRRHARRPT